MGDLNIYEHYIWISLETSKREDIKETQKMTIGKQDILSITEKSSQGGKQG